MKSNQKKRYYKQGLESLLVFADIQETQQTSYKMPYQGFSSTYKMDRKLPDQVVRKRLNLLLFMISSDGTTSVHLVASDLLITTTVPLRALIRKDAWGIAAVPITLRLKIDKFLETYSVFSTLSFQNRNAIMHILQPIKTPRATQSYNEILFSAAKRNFSK